MHPKPLNKEKGTFSMRNEHIDFECKTINRWKFINYFTNRARPIEMKIVRKNTAQRWTKKRAKQDEIRSSSCLTDHAT